MSTTLTINETAVTLTVGSPGTNATLLRGVELDLTTVGTPTDLYVISYDAASGKYVTADVHTIISGTYVDVAGDTMTGALVLAPTAAATVPLRITGHATQSGELLVIENNAGTDFVTVTSAGAVTISQTLGVTGALTASGGVDGVVGGVTPAAGTFTSLNATGGGALTGTWTDLGSVTTVDINGGSIDGATIGAATQAAGSFTTLIATGAGPHAYGSTDPDAFLRLNTAFTGTGTNVAGLQFDATLTPPLNGVAWAVVLSPTLVEGASGTHSDFGTLKVRPPSVTPGGATVTNLTTFKVTAPPSGGVNNRAFWVVSGLSEVDVLTVTGALTASGGVDGVVGGVTPAAGSFTTLIVSDDVTVNGSTLAVSNDTNPKVRLSDSSPGGVSVEFQAISTNQANFGTTTNHPLWFVTNNQVQLGINAAGNLLFGSTGDVALFRGAANRLDLASGDSFAILDGHLAVGGTTSSNILAFLTGTHPSVEVGLQIQPTLQPDAGTESAMVHVLGTIAEAASGTHAFLAGARFTAPTVTPGSATVTNAATLYVDSAISTTVTGRKEALWVGGTSYFSSTVEIDGAFDHDGSTFGALGATPQAQQAHIVDADGTLADITTKFNALLADLEGFGFLAAA